MTISSVGKSVTRILAALALVIGLQSLAQAQVSTATVAAAHATADIVAPITISESTQMNFGGVVSGAAPGTVVLATDNSRTKTGVNTFLGNSASAAAGVFAVGGEPNATYALTLPSTPQTLTHTNTVDTMTLTVFTSTLDISAGIGTLSGGGAQNVSVGATLNVGAAQTAGHYAGTFAVTVAYN
jgi:hypothetical protein